MSAISHFNQLLVKRGIPFRLSVRDNRTVMVSVRYVKKKVAISLHRMFEEAPFEIIEALAEDIACKRRKLSKAVKFFIDKKQQSFDYSHRIKSLDPVGQVYHLQELYQRLNRDYFNSTLDLAISYFGSAHQKRRSRCSLGLYQGDLKLIKIHRLLDNGAVPEYVISFVIYHEMVHALHPVLRTKEGRQQIHHASFKAEESRFSEFKKAKAWIKENKLKFFLR